MKIRTGLMLAAMVAATDDNRLCPDRERTPTRPSARCAIARTVRQADPAGKSMKIAAFNSPEVSKMSEADMITAIKNGKGKMPATQAS